MAKMHIQTRLNGDDIEFLAEPRQSLLEVLRDNIGLTGTKEGCNNGNCGACSVMLNGRVVNSCCVLAVETQGAEVSTIEGLARGDQLHPLQQAFRHPFHHRLPDRLLARKVTKQRALRQVHVLGDGGCGDLAGVLQTSQFDDRLNSYGAALVCGELFGSGFHRLVLAKSE